MVALPESRPEDDEDVVWGLSTASALWARGERRDAIVWLRRAADAAVSAGQEFRGSELGMYASELEDGLGPAGNDPESAAIEGAAAAISAADAAPESIELLDIEADRPSQISIDLEDERPTHPATPPPPPPPGRIALTPGPVPPPRSAFPPPAPIAPISSPPQHIAPASSAPQPISAAPPFAASAAPVVIPPPAPLGIAAPPAPQMPHSFEQTPMPASPALRAAPTSSRRMTPTPSRKSQPRGPILDPWADEPTDPGSSPVRPTVSFRQSDGGGDELVLPRRAPAMRGGDPDDEVVTSAAPLDASLTKKVEPRPPRKVVKTQPSVAAPGQLAQAAAIVPSKGLSVPPPSAPTSAPALKAIPPAPPPPTKVAVAPPTPPVEAPRASAPAAVAPPDSAPPVVVKPPPPPIAATSPATSKPSVPPPAMPWPAPAAARPSVPPVAAPTIPKPPTPPAPAVASTVAAPTVAAATIAAPALPAAASAHPPPRITIPPPPAVAGAPRLSVPPPPAVPSAPKASVAPSASVAPPAPAKLAPPAAPVLLDGLPLDEVDAFVDLPPEMQQRLVALARIEALSADEEVSSFGAALLLAGEASVCATIVDTPACRAVKGTLIPSRGSLAEPVGVRVVAGSQGARVAIWEQPIIEEALASCPWVLDELVSRADRIQALAGATMGPLGEVDEASRGELLDRLTVHFAQPFESLVDAGDATLGIAVVGGGVVELGPNGDVPAKALHPGETLFARAVLEGLPAPRSAHAGASGALVLIGEAKLAKELMASCPPLAALFGDASE